MGYSFISHGGSARTSTLIVDSDINMEGFYLKTGGGNIDTAGGSVNTVGGGIDTAGGSVNTVGGGIDILPSGTIALWSGAVANIPSGWALCNGTNGTPDLRNRFVVGAGSSYSVGDAGGSNTHTLVLGEMPSHGHTIRAPVADAEVTGTFLNDSVIRTGNYKGTGLSLPVPPVGGGAAHENRPPYYALCYIMRL